ncbi:signal peptide-containing protein [Theileria equi strain WA]|uniref:Signal peptide-containing protein n=1 Tax=Theileria equi strain WA TaxID=1537102 RepID=L0B0N5_THEEQ|nr:signal peptide-containing protein [Theileria equi strain WA]AFZ80704.1 signal peptide-containing protein [Theileria equi strain WA]|eukprot:XP_004830370.1 signal peptide-containing protein [Theileria equi strain WA]
MNALLRVPLLLTIFLSTKSALGDYGNLHSETEEIRSIIVIDNDFEDAEDVEEDPQRIPITLDIAMEVPAIITATNFSGAFYYEIDQDYHEDYKIGDVMDDWEVISEDNDLIVERFVYFCREDDGRKVVRITDYCIEDNGEIISKVNELVKEPGSHYLPLTRYHIEIDIISNDLPNEIERITDPSGETVFRVRPQSINTAYIGLVRYGDLPVDELLRDCIIEKIVILDTSGMNPKICVLSLLRENNWISSEYSFITDENGGRIVYEDDE